MPKLSIITINYNNANGLTKTIESVVNQSFKDFEYIIIDGGSTDDSINIIKKYENKITFWVSEQDSGIYHAMNKGIRQAEGDYCQFLNSGDMLASSRVIEIVFDNPTGCNIIVGNMLKQSNGSIYRDKGIMKNTPNFYTFFNGTLNHSTSFIKRDLFDIYGLYDETLKIVSDWKWFLQVVGIAGEPIFYINLDITIFDMTGISNRLHSLNLEERKSVLLDYIPNAVLADYSINKKYIDQGLKLHSYFISKLIINLLYKIVIYFDKY